MKCIKIWNITKLLGLSNRFFRYIRAIRFYWKYQAQFLNVENLVPKHSISHPIPSHFFSSSKLFHRSYYQVADVYRYWFTFLCSVVSLVANLSQCFSVFVGARNTHCPLHLEQWTQKVKIVIQNKTHIWWRNIFCR